MSALWRKAVVLLLACSLARGAQAQDASLRERAEASFRAGAAAYAAGEYLAAIQALEAAYELTPLPAIAFSLAQAERRHYFVAHEPAHLERAIALFRSYIGQVPSGGRRADAVDALLQLEPLASATGADAGARGAAQVKTTATRLLISCDAPGAQISLDASDAVAAPLIREVSPGKHQARVEAEGFFPAERELVAVEGELILGEVRLQERPSSLQLATPDDAEVYVDGSFVAQGGARVELALPAGAHRLAVGAKGRRTEYRSLQLARGETHTLRVELPRTPQRVSAIALFGVASAALATGVVLGGVAIHHERAAQDFLAERERDNVSSSALAAYQDDASARDLYRTLAITGLASSAALFATALLLYELDRPNPRDVQRDARSLSPPSPREAARRASPSLTLAPWLGRGVLGAAFAHAF
jgi:PEGA domain